MKAYLPKNILVTGGAGFIGSHFIHYMLTKYPQLHIVNLDKLTYAGRMENLADLASPERHFFIKGDILDRKLIADILYEYNIETLVHFAAESHVDRSIAAPDVFIQTNIVGTWSLLETARQVWINKKGYDKTTCRFHHISTDEVFGMLDNEASPFTEHSSYAPNSPYSASKAGADHMVRAYLHTYGLPVTLSNCSNNYGIRQHPEKFIPSVIAACLQKTSIPVYGTGENIRDWLHVDDHCRAIDLILRQGTVGETYNIGGNNEWRNIDLAKTICKIMDELFPMQYSHENLIRFVTDRPGHDWRYAIDASKLNVQLAWQPTENFHAALKDIVRYFASNKNKLDQPLLAE